MKTFKPQPVKENNLARQVDIRRGILKTLKTWDHLKPGHFFGWNHFYRSVTRNAGRMPGPKEMDQALSFLTNAGRIRRNQEDKLNVKYYYIPLCTK